jgi:hypothetical protein
LKIILILKISVIFQNQVPQRHFQTSLSAVQIKGRYIDLHDPENAYFRVF